MRFPILLALFVSAGWGKVYPLDGLVIEIDRAARKFVVSHRAIPKLMPAMVMPFPVENAAELDGLHPGARVRFELVVTDGRSIARNILKTAEQDIPAVVNSPTALRIGEQVPDFTFIDQDARPVSLAGFRGKVVALNFIYTRCPMPDVCPRLSAGFALMQRRFQDRVTLLSVTIDPQHDTPAVLARYAKQWRAEPRGWRFLTGSMGQIAQVAQAFGLQYWPDEGALLHNSRTAIIGRDGRLRAVLEGSSHRVDQLGNLIARQLEGAL